jgi:uncharacterized protein YbbK (DUF523 family)
LGVRHNIKTKGEILIYKDNTFVHENPSCGRRRAKAKPGIFEGKIGKGTGGKVVVLNVQSPQ